jgi:hypothetical protein
MWYVWRTAVIGKVLFLPLTQARAGGAWQGRAFYQVFYKIYESRLRGEYRNRSVEHHCALGMHACPTLEPTPSVWCWIGIVTPPVQRGQSF